MSEADTTVLHHDDHDGFCSAWVARHFLPDPVEYKAVNYGQEPPWDLINGKTVYLFDFSYERPEMEEIFKRAKEVVHLDHHKSAKEKLDGLGGSEFDMNRSGCKMTLDWFLEHKSRKLIGLPHITALVDYAQDYDLHTFDLPKSKEINAYIHSFPMTFEVWDRIVGKLFNFDGVSVTLKSGAVSRGKAILEMEKRQAEDAIEEARRVELGDHSVMVLNISTKSTINSAAGALAALPDVDYSLAWFQQNDGQFECSLRSRGSLDVSEIAKAQGGGGHPNAAGFQCKVDHAFMKKILGLGEKQ